VKAPSSRRAGGPVLDADTLKSYLQDSILKISASLRRSLLLLVSIPTALLFSGERSAASAARRARYRTARQRLGGAARLARTLRVRSIRCAATRMALSFTLRSPDSTSAYAVSVSYDSIAISPCAERHGRPAPRRRSHRFPPEHGRRFVLPAARDGGARHDDGTREVLEILELHNKASRRV